MKEKKTIDHFKEFVEQEMQRQSERIDAEVEANRKLHPCEFPEELDQKIMERIRLEEEKQRAYELLSEEDKEALKLGREAMLLRELKEDDETYEEETTSDTGKNVVLFKKRSKKAFLLVALVAILVLMFGMTGIGGRPFILEMMGVDIGEKKLMRVESESDEENARQIGEEDKLEQKIKETFNTNFVRMGYLPKKTDFLTGEVNRELGKASMLYLHEEEIIEYQMIFNYQTKSFGYDVEDELISEIIMEINEIPIEVSTYQLPDGEEQQVAEFAYQNTYYILNGIFSEEEFEKIIKNLIFF